LVLLFLLGQAVPTHRPLHISLWHSCDVPGVVGRAAEEAS
jgi:hypothetical protein